MADNRNIINEDMDDSIDRMLEARRNQPSRVSPAQSKNSPPQRAAMQNKTDGQRTAARQTQTAQGFSDPHYRMQNTQSQRQSQAASYRNEATSQTSQGARTGATPPGQRITTPAGPKTPAGQRIQTPPSRQGLSATGGTVHTPPSQKRISERRVSENAHDVDDDIKIASKKRPSEPSIEATRKTEITAKAKVKSKSGKSDNAKSSDNDIGGGLVVSLVRAVVYIVFISVVSAILSVFIINVGNDVFAFVKDDEIIDITIPENATRGDIAEILYENGVIKYKGIFELYGSFKHIEEDFVAGDYTVTPMMNYKSLYYEFKEKPVSGTSRITIPEGFSTDEIIDFMLSYGIGGTKEDYIRAINEDEYDYWFVKELDESGVMASGDRFYRLDGYLFPDTYEFYNASSAHTVINKFLQRFDEIYTEVFKQRATELGLTTDQAVILASIIEKEAGHSSDFRNVSSVFHNRLSNPGTYPRLESDATVVYAIQHITGERPNNVNHETISYESPYNTYLHDSFPPGAIANPGLNALKYAVYPADTNYYYFVSSSSGMTLFASSKWEHDRNVAYIRNYN